MTKNTKNKKISISVQGGGLSYKGEVDQDTAAQILTLCLSENEGVGIDILSSKKSIADIDDSYKSIAEYLDQINPKRNPDKIITMAGYLREKGRPFFTSKDIKPLFSKASEPIPGNFGRDFRWVQSVKWIAEADDKRGQFYITKKGLRVLQEGFPKELVKESRGKAHKGRSRHKK